MPKQQGGHGQAAFENLMPYCEDVAASELEDGSNWYSFQVEGALMTTAGRPTGARS
jgi:hypothetical protein